MRDFLKSTYNVFSIYELALLLAALIIPVLLLSAYSYRVTKERKLVLINVLSALASLVGFSVVSYTIQYFWRDVTNGLMQIAFYFNLIALFTSLMQLYLYYREEMSEKRFDPDHITRKHFKFSVDAVIVFALLLSATLIFLPTTHRVVTASAVISSLVTLALVHLASRKLLKDKSSK